MKITHRISLAGLDLASQYEVETNTAHWLPAGVTEENFAAVGGLRVTKRRSTILKVSTPSRISLAGLDLASQYDAETNSAHWLPAGVTEENFAAVGGLLVANKAPSVPNALSSADVARIIDMAARTQETPQQRLLIESLGSPTLPRALVAACSAATLATCRNV